MDAAWHTGNSSAVRRSDGPNPWPVTLPILTLRLRQGTVYGEEATARGGRLGMATTTYNGVPIPGFMYGTAWKKEATTRLVLEAVKAGFTAIDTANQPIHYDETRVGEALLRLREEGVARDGLCLQTKFTPLNGQDHRTPYDVTASITTQVLQSFESSLAHLHTDYLDSYVLHGPYHRGGLGAEDWEVWAAIESLYAGGRTQLIGVSNVSAGQLALLCDRATH